MVRQHVDLKAIETKLQKGCYSSCVPAFYRDLLLLFTNATIFFPKSSLESVAAHELRLLVSKELKKNTHDTQSGPSPEPSDSAPPTNPLPTKRSELETSDLFSKNKRHVPIIVCRKRSSISSKPSPSSFAQKDEQPNEEKEKKPVIDLKPSVATSNVVEDQGAKPKEKPVTGTRSSRRGKESAASNNVSTPSKKQSLSVGKVEKKKPEALPTEKKRSAADFLKRIKRNSATDTQKGGRRGEGSGGGEQKGKDSGKGDKRLRPSSERKAVQKEKGSPSKRSVGRPPKKTAEANAVSAKRSREGGGKESSKRPRKRSRR